MSDKISLSATSMGTFKTCPMKYYYRYILGLAPIEETESLRVGTNYHRIQEIYDAEPGGVCECQQQPIIQGRSGCLGVVDCELCEGTGVNPDDPMDAVIRHLNKQYSEPPISKTVEEWETEKITLLYTLVGYRWWYQQQDQPYDVEALEQKFELPLLSPDTGHPLKAKLIGKIDKIFAAGNNRFVHDYKSTSKAVDPDSTFWSHLTLDTQTRLYTYAAQQLGLGLCGVVYDAWHKPGIRPKKLTQAGSKEFVETEEYCGERFTITWDITNGPPGDGAVLTVNGKPAEVEPGKEPGTFAIKETPQMFGARLLQDITTRPEFYFARKEIAHNSRDLEAFQWELFNIYQSIRSMARHNRWWRNEQSCEATYKCEFCDLCYNNIELGPDDVPDNFVKRGR